MTSNNELQLIGLVPFFDSVRAECHACSSWWFAPSYIIIIFSLIYIHGRLVVPDSSVGSAQRRSVTGPSWGTSLNLSRLLKLSRLSRDGEIPPWTQKYSLLIKAASGKASNISWKASQTSSLPKRVVHWPWKPKNLAIPRDSWFPLRRVTLSGYLIFKAVTREAHSRLWLPLLT